MYGEADPPQATIEQTNVQLMARSLSIDNLSSNQMSGVYQSSASQITPIGNGEYLLTWTADVPSRNAYNRTALMYAIYADGVINEPKMLIDDGYADLTHTIHVQDDRVFIAWQRTMETLNSTMTPEEASNSLDIFVAEFDKDTGEFADIQRITDDNTSNSDPQFVMNASVPTLVWKSSEGGIFLGFGGTTQIKSVQLIEGTWSNPQQLYTTTNAIFNHTTAIIDNQMVVVVEEKIGDDIFELETLMHVVRDSKIEQLMAANANNLNFILLDNMPTLLFSQENNLMSTVNFVDIKQEIEQIATDYRVSNSRELPTIVYEGVDEDNLSQGNIAVYNGGRWTKDIVLTNEQNSKDRLFSTSVHNSGDNAWFIYNIEDEFGNVSFKVDSKQVAANMTVEVFAQSGVIQNAYNTIRLVVKNNGATLIDALRINISGQEILIDNFESISIGQTREFDFEFFMNSPSGQDLPVAVEALDSNNQILTSKYIEISTKYSNVQAAFSMQVNNGKQVFTVNLKNNGEFATKTKLYIWLNNTTYKTMDIALEICEEWIFDISFDEINISDSIMFFVATEFEDINSTDKLATFFSIQDETQARIDFSNPYADLLNNAKGIAF